MSGVSTRLCYIVGTIVIGSAYNRTCVTDSPLSYASFSQGRQGDSSTWFSVLIQFHSEFFYSSFALSTFPFLYRYCTINLLQLVMLRYEASGTPHFRTGCFISLRSFSMIKGRGLYLRYSFNWVVL